MVDLNLKPVPKQKPVSAKSYQTLEQARMQAPKEKVPVLPPAPPVPVAAVGLYGTNMPAQGGYYQPGMGQQQQQMYNTVGAGYGMNGGGYGAPNVHNSAMVAYGGNFGMPQQQMQQQQFHTQMQPGFPLAKANAFGSDPFATLS